MSKNKLQVYEELILNVLTQIRKDQPLKSNINSLAWFEFRKNWKEYNNVRKTYVVVEVGSDQITFNTDHGTEVTIKRSSWSNKCSKLKKVYNSYPEGKWSEDTSKQFTLHHDQELLELKARLKVLELNAGMSLRTELLESKVAALDLKLDELQKCNARIGDKIAAKPWHEGHEPQGGHEHYVKPDKPQYDPELRYVEGDTVPDHEADRQTLAAGGHGDEEMPQPKAYFVD